MASGVKKTSLHLDGWFKDAAPSTELRKWFSHDPEKWEEFRRRYFAELDRAPGTWEPILQAARKNTVTLVYSSHDTEHNNAVALKEYIEQNKSSRAARPAHASVIQDAQKRKPGSGPPRISVGGRKLK